MRTVNTENVELELGEYEETTALNNIKDTKQAQEVAINEVKKYKPKVRKLSKKLLLIPATEAIDEPKIEPMIVPQKKTKKTKIGEAKSTKKLLIIESDED